MALSAAHEHDLAAHLAGCDACAAEMAAFDTLSRWTAALPVEEPPANFEWRLKLRLARIERQATRVDWPLESQPRRPWRGAFEFGGALAAAAVVVVWIGAASWRGSTPQAPTPALPPAPSGGVLTQLRNDDLRVGPMPPVPAVAAAESSAADSLR
jgi:anti-sigma factor RsiW